MSDHPRCPACHAENQADWLLCKRCTDQLRRDLDELPWLLRELLITFTRQSQAGSGNGGKGAETALPFDTAASDLRAGVVNTLGTWIRELDWGDTGDLAHNPRAWCQWLNRNIERIRGHQAVEEIVAEIASAVKQVRRLIDRPAARLWCGHCPVCEADLYARPGQATVICQYCAIIARSQKLEPAEYDVAATREPMIAELWDSLATAQELVDAVPRAYNVRIQDKDVERWVKHGRLLEQGRRQGRPTYHIGTAVTLAQESDTLRRRA